MLVAEVIDGRDTMLDKHPLEATKKDLQIDGFSETQAETRLGVQIIYPHIGGEAELIESLKRNHPDAILANLGPIYSYLQSQSCTNPTKIHEVVVGKLKELFKDMYYRFNASSTSKNLFRYRSLIFLFVEPKIIRNSLVGFMLENIQKNSIGPTQDLSFFCALHYSELLQMFPGDTELIDMVNTILQKNNDWFALHSLTHPTDIPQCNFEIPESVLENDVVGLSNVYPLKRDHAKFDVCDKAEGGHLNASLRQNTGTDNKFIFVDRTLIGSIKIDPSYRTDLDRGINDTVLGMRTVRCVGDKFGGRFKGTYPVIEGGIYSPSEELLNQAIATQGDVLHVQSAELMPKRFIEFYNPNPDEQMKSYIECIRKKRTEVQSRFSS